MVVPKRAWLDGGSLWSKSLLEPYLATPVIIIPAKCGDFYVGCYSGLSL